MPLISGLPIRADLFTTGLPRKRHRDRAPRQQAACPTDEHAASQTGRNGRRGRKEADSIYPEATSRLKAETRRITLGLPDSAPFAANGRAVPLTGQFI